MKDFFIFKGKKLEYMYRTVADGDLLYNMGDRVVEIPLAIDFFAGLENKSRVCEIGNVLSNYVDQLGGYPELQKRCIVDKYEVGPGVINADLLALPSDKKYGAIISISTVEHIGQAWGGHAQPGGVDLEAPLKAVAKIYDLLEVGGKALMTVPFGRLTAGADFVQFSKEYLDLLVTKYGIPQSAVTRGFLKRVIALKNIWTEAAEDDAGKMESGTPMPFGNGLGVIELTKLPGPFSLNLNVPPTKALLYEEPFNLPVIALVAYQRLLLETSGMISLKIALKKTPNDILREGLPAKWEAWAGGVPLRRWLESIYWSLSADNVGGPTE
jgi:hypothetical protein